MYEATGRWILVLYKEDLYNKLVLGTLLEAGDINAVTMIQSSGSQISVSITTAWRA